MGDNASTQYITTQAQEEITGINFVPAMLAALTYKLSLVLPLVVIALLGVGEIDSHHLTAYVVVISYAHHLVWSNRLINRITNTTTLRD